MNADQQRQLDELLSALCDGAANESQVAALARILEQSQQARRYYAEYLVLHGDLSWEMPARLAHADGGLAHADGGLTPQAPLASLMDSAGPAISWGAWMRQPWVASLSIAAALMLAVLATLGMIGMPRPDEAPAGAPQYVARMSRTMHCIWKDGGLAKADGADLFVGQELDLLEGAAVITFDSGAQVILEGRTTFRIGSALSGRLGLGKLSARVPPPASGFTIASTCANVIDRGTEFGVQVAESQDTRVHVFAGKVEVEVLSRSGHIVSTEGLAAGQGMQLLADSRKFEAAPALPAEFTREFPTLDDLPITPAYVKAIMAAKPAGYWRCEQLGSHVPNQVGPNYPARVVGALGLVSGAGNRALRFDGGGGYLMVDEAIEDFGRGDYSIEFWMLPQQFHYSTLISLHVPPTDEPKAQYDHHGVIELQADTGVAARDVRRIRFLHRSPPGTAGGTNVFSAQRYELQNWQHVVALKQADELKLYLNGQPVASQLEPSKFTQSPLLGIGRLVHPGTRADRPFRGMLDEIAIYKRALSADEIMNHYRLVENARQ